MSSITAITTVNASVVQAPLPSTLQQTGALISQGATTLAPQTIQSCPNLAAVLALLAPPKQLATLNWSGSVVTATTTAPHGWTNGDTIAAQIAGCTPTGYNVFVSITITGSSSFTYPLASNPGAAVTLGTVVLSSENELIRGATTYFSGNGVPAINVLELGETTTAEAITALGTWLQNNPNDQADGGPTPLSQYAYLLPAPWDAVSSLLTLMAQYEAPNKLTYFYVTTSIANYSVYAGMKNVFALVQSPTAPNTERTVASPFGTALKQSPSSSNKVPPMSYAPAFGVTAYPIPGNQAQLTAFATGNANWIGTGAAGGLPSNNIVFQGNMMDGNPWNFWYSVDWMQINSAIALSNETINGSATSLNPLYYDQDGIDRLQNRLIQTGNQAVTYGLALGQVVATKLPINQFLTNFNSGLYTGQLVINAEPFNAYVAENPSDYSVGKYAGFAAVYPPLRGFLNIFFNLTAVTFA